MKSAIYIRCSNEAQDRETLKVQKEKCLVDAKNRDKDVYPTIFTDDGWSGAEKARPAFTEMLELVKRGEINEIIVYRLDRFSRKLLHAVEIMEDLKKFNCNLVSWTEKIDFSTATGKLLFQILVMFAEFERETTLQRTMDAKRRRRQEGKHASGPPVWGYKYNKEKKELEVKMGPDGETPIVKLLFETYCREKNQSKVGKAFNMRQSSVCDALKREVYFTGKHVLDGYAVDYPKVIDKALFDRAKRIRETQAGKIVKRSGYDFILKNKAYHKDCGKLFNPKWVIHKGKDRKKKEYVYYSHHPRSCGKNIDLEAQKFEKDVFKKAQVAIENPDRLKNQIDKTVEQMQKQGNEYLRQIAEKKRLTEKHEKRAEKIEDKMLDSDVNWDDWNERKRLEKTKVRKLENEITELQNDFNRLIIPTTKTIGEMEKAFKNMDLRKSPELIDQLLGVKSIEVASDGSFVLHIVSS